MRRSTVIATCLYGSSMFTRMEDAEAAVRHKFAQHFPNDDFNRWNTELDERTSQHIIKSVGRASDINVRLMILDLWK